MDAVKNTNASISEAANIAGLSYRDFYNKMIEAGLRINYTVDKKHIDGILKYLEKSKKK